MFESILILAFAGTLAWLLVRLFPRRGRSRTGAQMGAARAKAFSAVSVYCAPTGCQAAKSMKGRRFLSSDAPHLPLDECTVKKCHCVYRHHTDRRTGNGERRAIGTGTAYLISNSEKDRRQLAGRRGIDTNDNLSWT